MIIILTIRLTWLWLGLASAPSHPRVRSPGGWPGALLAIAIAANTGCVLRPFNSSGSGRLVVVTTFVPITNFTQAVAGDRAEVTQLLPDNVGPHDYQARPEDAGKLARADVLVKNGLGLEDFLADLVENAGRPDLKIIDSSQGVPIGLGTPAAAEPGASPQPSPQHQNDQHRGQPNPHIYLDPKRAILQVATIRDGLIAADPSGKALYQANAAAYIAQLRQLDRQITAQLRPFAGKTFVTYHDFAGYFAQSYQLKTQFLVDIPEQNPAPGDIQRVIRAVRQSDLKTLLSEPQAATGQFAALAKDLNIQVSRFDSLETGGPEASQPAYYLGVMAANVNHLVKAFSASASQIKGTLSPWPICGVPTPRSPLRSPGRSPVLPLVGRCAEGQAG